MPCSPTSPSRTGCGSSRRRASPRARRVGDGLRRHPIVGGDHAGLPAHRGAPVAPVTSSWEPPRSPVTPDADRPRQPDTRAGSVPATGDGALTHGLRAGLLDCPEPVGRGHAAEGKAVPPDRELDAIARRPQTWREDISASPEARYWGPVIDHLLNQVGLGVLPVIAVAHVPGSLTPVGPPPEPPVVAQPRTRSRRQRRHRSCPRAGTATGAHRSGRGPDHRVDRVAGRQDRRGCSGGRDDQGPHPAHLAKRAPVSAEQLRKKLPGAGALVDELAALFARFTGGQSAPTAPVGPPAPTGPLPQPTYAPPHIDPAPCGSARRCRRPRSAAVDPRRLPLSSVTPRPRSCRADQYCHPQPTASG